MTDGSTCSVSDVTSECFSGCNSYYTIPTRQSQWLDELCSCCLVSLALCASLPGSPKTLLTQEAPWHSSRNYFSYISKNCCCCRQVASVVSDSVRPHRRKPTRPSHPWDSPGKNTGVGCHFLLQCMKVKSESEVTQLCPSLCDPMDRSPPGSSLQGIFQARVLLTHNSQSYGVGNGNLLQYSWLENPMDRGAWQATVHGVTRVRHDGSDLV